nr:alkaline phosphatase family protein [Salinirubrum litoreum]
MFGADADRPLPADVFDGVDGVTTDDATDGNAAGFGTSVDRIVTVVVDGYGLDSWKRDQGDYDFLGRLTDGGTVTPLTSVYPSETAAAITTFETGQLPCEHGRTGWNVYDPETDRSFLPLGGRVKAGPEAGAAHVTAGDEAVLVAPEASTGVSYHYDRLADAGVDCHRLQPFPESSPGVTQHEYGDLEEFGARLAGVTMASATPGYVYGYVPHVDAVSHDSGTEGDDFQSTLATVCEQLSAFVADLDAETAANTLLLITADHGHVNTDPDRNVDLSDNETLMANLRRHADGTPVCLSGSMRNVHLHLQEGTVEETRRALSDLDAHVFTR